jgi:hypothetical protein
MFEAFEMIIARLTASEDVSVDRVVGSCYYITVDDFEGFDDDYCEVMRDYADEEMIDALFELLESAESIEGDMYRTYRFADFSVRVGFTSYDI